MMMKATRKKLLNWAPNYVEPIQENEDIIGKQFTSTKNGCPKKKNFCSIKTKVALKQYMNYKQVLSAH